VEEIERYSEAFWKNYKSIENYARYLERIERGEEEIIRRQMID